ncbi:hypothetical protein D9758_005323 [Tetrapyrgos nigripes]|uniref:Cytochrome P450 n=1 Tax=Tetrapyrgos nigripes TaxID=182062 RepID=A0A8H5LQ23_9AGAR|nr:hypothetical protein D9758_005323 [Tetrapyrgos nigripes]
MGTHKSDSQQARPPLWLPCAIAVATYLVLHFSEPVGPRKSPTAANRAILLVGFGLVWSCFAALWTQTAAAAASGFSETPDPVSILPQARAILTSSAVYFASLITSVICYRISPLHPLAGVPGPFWYKTSKLFGAWIAWKGKTHLLSKKWHDTYGPIVRTGPNEISILDAEAIPAVLGTGGLSKGQFYDGRWDPNAPAGSLLILKDEDHASRRRLWTRGMSSQALKEYEGFIGNRANILIEKLEAMAGAGSSVDIAEWISYFTFDFMGDMAFGFDFEFLRNAGDKDGLLGAMRRFAIAVQVVCHIPWVATYANKIPMFGRDMQILRAFGVGAATRRVKVGASSKDLWYHLTDEAGFEKSKPSIASVVADGTLAIVAGADTTVSALSSLFYFLLSDPTCYKRLQQEVDAVYPPGSDPLDVSKHAELVFMNGCLNEALRLQPASSDQWSSSGPC